jgi:TM2 domain-containing membrane protein YozV
MLVRQTGRNLFLLNGRISAGSPAYLFGIAGLAQFILKFRAAG